MKMVSYITLAAFLKNQLNIGQNNTSHINNKQNKIMGLDMYIKYTNRTHHTIEELRSIDASKALSPETPEAKEFLPLREYKYTKGVYTIFHECAYWRKANAIHAWFVDNVQNSVDDCGYYELTREQLESLKNVCKEAEKTKNPHMLQPGADFFFGSTAVDDWYWSDIKDTIKQLNNALKMNWETHRFFYTSSW
jgi:hypothetical protein